MSAPSLLSCCHFLRCSPNHEIRIAASRNGIIAGGDGGALAQIADGALVAERGHQVGVGVGGLAAGEHQISWKSVKVNSTENVITTAMIGVSRVGDVAEHLPAAGVDGRRL